LGYNNSHHETNINNWERNSRSDINFVREEPKGRGIIARPVDGPTASEDKKDDTLELLLAQARQVQQEQLAKKRVVDNQSSVAATEKKQSESDKKKEETKQREEEERKRRLFEEQQRQAREEERKRLELEKEQEEQRQLLALVGDDTEVDDSNKRSNRDDDGDIFEFETQEEKEERLAQKRREERRKKLKVMESSFGDKIDEPRNVAGIVASEMEGLIPANSDNASPLEPNANSIEKADSDDDSFDIFATDNATPIPTQSNNSRKNALLSKSNIEECDDAEGYYKATIGEIITLPNHSENSEARYRVLGIIGKGVFSTVIKVVELSSGNHSREMAMKIIRNNEVMAKAASKEMRILRMLCHGRASHDDKQDDDEKDQNHNIVRLIEVNPTDSSSYALPPPEFRSHCIFLFEYLPFNLREVLSKFGKNVGITLTAVRSYARQLLCALGHLERHRIVHGEVLC
jgi:serine/threonine-protein kinase PRP4